VDGLPCQVEPMVGNCQISNFLDSVLGLVWRAETVNERRVAQPLYQR